MKKVFLFSLALIALSFIMDGCGTTKSKQGASTGSKAKSISLFNGQNLDGWYKFVKGRGRDNDPKNVFSVEKGLIHISGEEYGCITSNEEYSNYKLTVEFKWGPKTYSPRVDKARDSGILLHSIGEDGGYSGTWMYSIECQIIEGGTGDFLVVGDGTKKFSLTSNVAPKQQGKGNVYLAGGQPLTINGGRIDWFARDPEWKDVVGFRGKNDVEKPVGQWNKVECVVIGDKVSAYLNGVLVNEAYHVTPTKGKIQIQSEGAEMFVRKVEIVPLASN
ncbi:protein of unknown function [Daejeonella rubra]|uniref:3-keto-alpha-glucoside-1,2-lyase/3-keto-2-hydroxy-glucal hydratase domain-containing protein n=1 Tax=Daejeonella rubra TaxID=990371 RepID=A0A1G9NUU7_9SPHI|nr:DUF1080 domain-containing protein [Daejeonella rubra]SDL90169.1 protein of unknown function [Daejeonella rubra]